MSIFETKIIRADQSSNWQSRISSLIHWFSTKTNNLILNSNLSKFESFPSMSACRRENEKYNWNCSSTCQDDDCDCICVTSVCKCDVECENTCCEDENKDNDECKNVSKGCCCNETVCITAVSIEIALPVSVSDCACSCDSNCECKNDCEYHWSEPCVCDEWTELFLNVSFHNWIIWSDMRMRNDWERKLRTIKVNEKFCKYCSTQLARIVRMIWNFRSWTFKSWIYARNSPRWHWFIFTRFSISKNQHSHLTQTCLSITNCFWSWDFAFSTLFW
jgi:hypothetical protein